MSYPIPNPKPELAYQSGLITYQLTDVERAYLSGGELHRIPTAGERGLTPDPIIHAVPISRQRGYSGKYQHMTRELLLRELATGKMIKDIAAEQGVPYGMMDYLLKINGIHERRLRG